MKIVSFNVNGLRARIHQLSELIALYQPDIIGLQETKVADELFPLEEINRLGYHAVYHGQKSHYGVALLSKQPALTVQKGLATDRENAQCRLIIAEYATTKGSLRVINGYFPQGENREHPIKFPAKKQFYQDITQYLTQFNMLEQSVILMGDMNIAPCDIDIGIGEENKKRWLRTGKCSFLPEERQWLQQIYDLNLQDLFRLYQPTADDQYSWFDYRSKGFNDNRGLRIDLILASQYLARYCINSNIGYDIRAMEKPSDHAPIWAEFNFD